MLPGFGLWFLAIVVGGIKGLLAGFASLRRDRGYGRFLPETWHARGTSHDQARVLACLSMWPGLDLE